MSLSNIFYLSGVKQAQSAFGVVAPPPASKPSSAGKDQTFKAESAAKKIIPDLPKPPNLTPLKPPTLPPSPASIVQQGMATRVSDTAQYGAKVSGFNFDMTPKNKTRPGEISPNNIEITPGTNFDSNKPDSRVSAAFNNMNVMRNHDFLNESNEGTIGAFN